MEQLQSPEGEVLILLNPVFSEERMVSFFLSHPHPAYWEVVSPCLVHMKLK